MTQERMERSFGVASPARLSVSNIRGSVEVLPGDDGVIAVTAIKHPESGNTDLTEIVIEQEADGSVVVATRFPETAWRLWGRWEACAVDYALRVPRDCALKVESVVNSTSVAGLRGTFALSTVSGLLRLKDLSGALTVSGVSGEIAGERLSLAAPLRLSTVSGDVVLADCALPAIDASTVSGRLTVHTPLAEGPYKFSSMSGGVRLVVPRGTACSVSASSLSGRFRTTEPSSRSSGSSRDGRTDINGGGPRIRMSSVSGSLWILSDEMDASLDANPESPARTAPADRMEVLERIARGELSAEDGLAALGA